MLDLRNRRFLVVGVSNRKSVAWGIASALESSGAEVVFSVRSDERKESLGKLLAGRPCHVCDVEDASQIESLGDAFCQDDRPLDGFVHSIAFANYTDGFVPFHQTRREDFLQATQISAFSLVELARVLKPALTRTASVVTIGISSYVTAPTYGYMSPVKAALEQSARFLAKSFSMDSEIRFNVVNAGPLKTRSSAGIPGYLENYLYAEKMTLRKRGVTTEEVAKTALFLLSPASSGINGQSLVVNGGMDTNYFDEEIVRLAMRPEDKP